MGTKCAGLIIYSKLAGTVADRLPLRALPAPLSCKFVCLGPSAPLGAPLKASCSDDLPRCCGSQQRNLLQLRSHLVT